MAAGDETSPQASGIAGVLGAFRDRDPGAAARRVKLVLADEDVTPGARAALLHLGAMACHATGAGEDGADLLAEAARLEREELGCTVGSQHTVHQLSLLNQKDTGLAAVKRYYLETLKTLRSNRNAVGAGLCLRSLGEIALVGGAVAEARVCWCRARQHLEPTAAAEASQLGGWLKLLESVA